ncbi:MAG: phosphatase PAP2 family protein [Planctomycetota bacterium]
MGFDNPFETSTDQPADRDSAARPSALPTVLPFQCPNAIALPTSVLLWFAFMLLLTVPITTLVDIPIAHWFAVNQLPRELGNAIELSRVFSHGGSIALILVSIFLMAPNLRWHLPRLVVMVIGAGAIATLVKMFVLRPRPTGLDLSLATYDSAWLWAFDWSLSQVAAFDASTRAFPSGNVATATALTVGLWTVLPRGRWLFFVICFGTALQRLTCSAHFPSDIVGGAAFGLLWSYACMHPKLLGSLFDKMQPESEPRTSARANDPPPRAVIDPLAEQERRAA